MRYLFSALVGYFVGGINPALFIGRIKKTDLRNHGTGNLGATNVTLSVGKGYGVFVMLFDIMKAFFSAKIAAFFFPAAVYAGLVAGAGAVVGHVYPIYLGFHGGKGLAAFGGMILALDPLLFLLLLLIGLFAVAVTGYAVALTFSAAIAAPILAAWRTGNLIVSLLVASASTLLLWKHRENIDKIRSGAEKSMRDFWKDRKARQ